MDQKDVQIKNLNSLLAEATADSELNKLVEEAETTESVKDSGKESVPEVSSKDVFRDEQTGADVKVQDDDGAGKFEGEKDDEVKDLKEDTNTINEDMEDDFGIPDGDIENSDLKLPEGTLYRKENEDTNLGIEKNDVLDTVDSGTDLDLPEGVLTGKKDVEFTPSEDDVLGETDSDTDVDDGDEPTNTDLKEGLDLPEGTLTYKNDIINQNLSEADLTKNKDEITSSDKKGPGLIQRIKNKVTGKKTQKPGEENNLPYEWHCGGYARPELFPDEQTYNDDEITKNKPLKEKPNDATQSPAPDKQDNTKPLEEGLKLPEGVIKYKDSDEVAPSVNVDVLETLKDSSDLELPEGVLKGKKDAEVGTTNDDILGTLDISTDIDDKKLNEAIDRLNLAFENLHEEEQPKVAVKDGDDSTVPNVKTEDVLNTVSSAADLSDCNKAINDKDCDCKSVPAAKTYETPKISDMVKVKGLDYKTLKEAIELGKDWFDSDDKVVALKEQVAVLLAKENDDLLYEELSRLESQANAVREKIEKKYSIISNNRVDSLLESMDAVEQRIAANKDSMFKKLVEQQELNSTISGANTLSADEIAFGK